MSSRGSDVKTVATALLSALLTGCLSIEAPDRFVVTSASSSQLKAISTDDAVLWVRQFADPAEGDLEFWYEALKNDLVDNRGYTVLDEKPVEDEKLRKGREMTSEVTVQGIPHRYLMTLFVEERWGDNRIRVAEFVAPKTVFDDHVEGVRASIRTLRP